MSKAKSADSPWNTWPEEMAKARPIKRLCKRLPMSTDALAAIDRDNRREGMTIGEQRDPIAALNQSIVGAEPPPPALTNDPSPTFTFAAVEEMLRNAGSVDDLAAAVTAAQQVVDAEQREELLAMADVRRHELTHAD